MPRVSKDKAGAKDKAAPANGAPLLDKQNAESILAGIIADLDEGPVPELSLTLKNEPAIVEGKDSAPLLAGSLEVEDGAYLSAEVASRLAALDERLELVVGQLEPLPLIAETLTHMTETVAIFAAKIDSVLHNSQQAMDASAKASEEATLTLGEVKAGILDIQGRLQLMAGNPIAQLAEERERRAAAKAETKKDTAKAEKAKAKAATAEKPRAHNLHIDLQGHVRETFLRLARHLADSGQKAHAKLYTGKLVETYKTKGAKVTEDDIVNFLIEEGLADQDGMVKF